MNMILGTKFYFKQKTLNFGTIFAPKEYVQLKKKKLSTNINYAYSNESRY